LTRVMAPPVTHPRAISGGWVIGMAVSIAVLAIGIPGALIFTVDDVGRSQGWIITTVIGVWSGIRISVRWVRGIPRLFDFFFWVFTYIFIGIAATASMRAGDIPWTTASINPDLDVPTALITLGGVIAYEVGAFLRWASARKRPVSELPEVGISVGRALLLYLMGLAAVGYYVSKMGLSAIFSSRTNSAIMQSYIWGDSSTLAIIYAMAIYPLLVAVGAFAQHWRSLQPGESGRLGYPLLIAAGFVGLMLVANPLTSARYTAGTVAFALVMFLGAAATANRARLTMLGTIFAFLFVFPILNVFRNAGTQLQDRQSFFSEYIGNADYDAFFQIANAYSYVVDGLVVPGRQFLGSLLFWVPRSVWPDKPEDTGIMLADYRGYSFTNLSAPVWSELLVNGGVIAVVVGFIIIGFALRVLDDRMVPAYSQAGWWGVAGAILPVYSLILWRGSLLQATGALVVMMVGLIWIRKKSPPNTALTTLSR
jgi:hypothetical protein